MAVGNIVRFLALYLDLFIPTNTLCNFQSIQSKKSTSFFHQPTVSNQGSKQDKRRCATAPPAGSPKVVPSSSSNQRSHPVALNLNVSSPSDSPPTQRTATRQQHSTASMLAFPEAILSFSKPCRRPYNDKSIQITNRPFAVATVTSQAATSQNPLYFIGSRSLKLRAMDTLSASITDLIWALVVMGLLVDESRL